MLQVERMRGMFVESLVARNRGATVDIEQCESIIKFRCSFISSVGRLKRWLS